MTDTICITDRRREDVRKHAHLHGLDYLEVSEEGRLLTVYFLGRAAQLGPENLLIEGGVRITGIQVISVKMTTSDIPEFDDFMEVKLDKAGDFSPYRLVVVERAESGETSPHHAFDPRYNGLEFRFHVECLNELDCKEEPVCPPTVPVRPEINYLAKDYASFRKLIFDRLAVLIPEWKERHAPDFGVAIVELLAYTGDHLSYYQDAVATEAYLDTARQRISVRRHARLVDYRMHEGCNARAWLHLEAIGDPDIDLDDIYFITNARDRVAGLGRTTTRGELSEATDRLPPGAYKIFEPVGTGTVTLHEAHNAIRFYTWRDKECCLPRGATSAVLVADEGSELHLSPGDVLIFEEVLGPGTGARADANPAHRQVVRLVRVTPLEDPLDSKRVIEVAWSEEDALRFPLCLSVRLPAPRCEIIEDVSIARGNVILVDHGESTADGLGVVPPGKRTQECGCSGLPGEVTLTPGRYRPRLPRRPVTFRTAFDATTPASEALRQDPREAEPAITLASISGGPDGTEPLYNWEDLRNPLPVLALLTGADPDLATILLRSLLSPETRGLLAKYDPATPPPPELLDALRRDLGRLLQSWTAAPDLMAAFGTDSLFVVEMDNQAYGHLRFGDGTAGRRPDPGMFFQASYRVGNGPSGNVGAEAINTLVTRTVRLDGAVRDVRNPQPAIGGTAPQSLAEVKLLAPDEFRARLQRAIIAEDYAAIALRDFSANLQNAAASLRWTGNGYEVLVVVDPIRRETPDPALLEAIAGRLERYRRIGHAVVVKAAKRVPLEISLQVCALPQHRTDVVKRAVLDLFSNRVLPDGRLGFFHPDNLTFGQGIFLSRIIALAQSAPGVESVHATQFHRYGQPGTIGLETGVVRLGPLEIAQADNNPDFPEHGKIEVTVL